MKTCVKLLVGSLLFFAGVGAAQAQYPNSRPTVTPWLNLYRGGNPVALNYYNLVRPELDFLASIQQLSQQVGANKQALTDLTTPSGAPVTGHAAGFMTHGSYFQTQGAAGAS